jgi:hypothetical protein
MTGCCIGKVRYKNPKLALVPAARHAIRSVTYSWGEITFRVYDGALITNETMIYMLRAAENEIIRGHE